MIDKCSKIVQLQISDVDHFSNFLFCTKLSQISKSSTLQYHQFCVKKLKDISISFLKFGIFDLKKLINSKNQQTKQKKSPHVQKSLSPAHKPNLS